MTDAATETRARVEKGSASSTAFVFDDSGRERHMAVTVHHDGSGSLTIYDSKRGREMASISVRDYRQFRAIREAIDSQAIAADVARLRATP